MCAYVEKCNYQYDHSVFKLNKYYLFASHFKYVHMLKTYL